MTRSTLTIIVVVILSFTAFAQILYMLPHGEPLIIALSFAVAVVLLTINHCMTTFKHTIHLLLSYITLIVVLVVISLGILWPPPLDKQAIHTIGTALAIGTAILASIFCLATMVNIRILIPRLLLHNKFATYTLSLLGFVVISIGIEIYFEFVLINYYHIIPNKLWYLSDPNALCLRIISPGVGYFIGIAGTGIIYFMHLWKQSGRHLEDMESQIATGKLYEAREQIASTDLLDTLDAAADKIKKSPADVTDLLIRLSKFLRIQLYESRRKPHAKKPNHTKQTFNMSSPIVNFLTEKNYRAWRHLLMIAGFAMIISPNFTGSLSLPLISLVFLIPVAIAYLNIYVLTPKLMARGFTAIYLIASPLLFLIILTLLQVFHIIWLRGGMLSFLFINTLAQSLQISCVIFGVSVMLLFQHWIRNERRIAALETATTLSELEQLQNQVNPHFLFNMLNNIIVLTKTNPGEAEIVLNKLSHMLKYQFNGFTKKTIKLGDDIHFLSEYLNLEKLRRDNFEFSVNTDDSLKDMLLPPLLFIPFVENAVKHNNDNRNLSFVRLRFYTEGDTFCFVCVNSKPFRPTRKDEVGGLGLPNVCRRLDLLYGDNYRLDMTEDSTTYSIKLKIKIK